MGCLAWKARCRDFRALSPRVKKRVPRKGKTRCYATAPSLILVSFFLYRDTVMARQDRIDVLNKMQDKNGSKVIAYITGDRQQLFQARIAEDAARIMFDHLLKLGRSPKLKRIDLFLFSRGGDVSVPWRIISMLREFCEEFVVLIPYKAHSARVVDRD